MALVAKIRNAIKTKTPFFSLEFFPPQTTGGLRKLFSRIAKLARLEPMFINVTWRSFEERQRSLDLCDWIHNKLGIEVVMHVTCVGLSRANAKAVLESAKRIGIRNLLILRGDHAGAGARPESDFEHAIDLVQFVRHEYGKHFAIAVAGLPESASDSGTETYFQHLKEKVDAGADLIITQFFFDDAAYGTFIKKCRDYEIRVPVFPGVLIPPSAPFCNRITRQYGVSVPSVMSTKLRMLAHRPRDFQHFMIEFVVGLAQRLRQCKAPGLHFFTMNIEGTMHTILSKLGFEQTVASRRKLPWRSAGRQDEDVRPIFWAHRQQSYLAHTSSWHSLPTGRWRMNGEKPEWHAPQSKDENTKEGTPAPCTCNTELRIPRSFKERRVHWGNALATVDDVGDLFVSYLQGKVPFLPWSEEDLNAETASIREELIRINRMGFWTINSQPKVCGVASTDPTFGWGTPGGYVYQKAYVECFTSAKHLSLLMETIDQQPNCSLTYIASDVKGNIYTNSKFRGPNAVTWGVFVNDEVLQPTVVDHETFMVWKTEAFSLWLDAWAVIYEPDSRAHALIRSIHDNYFLVSLVDNNFINGEIYDIFNAVEEKMVQSQHRSASFAALPRYSHMSLSELNLDAEARFSARSSSSSSVGNSFSRRSRSRGDLQLTSSSSFDRCSL